MRAALFAAAALLASAHAFADPVAISNAGFEDLYLGSNLPPQYGGDVPTGSFPTGPAPAGWSSYFAGAPAFELFIGVLNPGTAADHAPATGCFPAGAPEGDNVVLLYADGAGGGDEYGVVQTLAATLAAHTHYTLTVEVGNIASCAGLVPPYQSFFVLDGFPGYRVQLLAGGVVVAEDAGALDPGEGLWETATVELTTGAAHAQLGQPLAIRLVNRHQPDVPGVSGLEVDFDDVRLDASPANAVPVGPWVGGVVAAGLALLGAAGLRVRRRAK
jgi:hapalindole H/12-epi-hapalindole U/12-epi-fischerindole U synthase